MDEEMFEIASKVAELALQVLRTGPGKDTSAAGFKEKKAHLRDVMMPSLLVAMLGVDEVALALVSNRVLELCKELAGLSDLE